MSIRINISNILFVPLLAKSAFILSDNDPKANCILNSLTVIKFQNPVLQSSYGRGSPGSGVRG